MHKSRLGVVVIDCKTDELGDALAFWSAALGCEGQVDDDGKYAVLKTPEGAVRVLLQAVDHDSRVHLDIETDDRQAETERLESIGARRIADIKRWTVMEAPTGHRFCVVGPQGNDFPGTAAVWGGET
jgi:predicted enzyme related to lactoylglutathione lyase